MFSTGALGDPAQSQNKEEEVAGGVPRAHLKLVFIIVATGEELTMAQQGATLQNYNNELVKCEANCGCIPAALDALTAPGACFPPPRYRGLT